MRRLPRGSDPARILLVRFARLGDVILLIPAIRALRHQFPNAHISVLVGHRCAPIIEMCSAVDEVVMVNRMAMRDGSKLAAARDILKVVKMIREAKYDLVVDFQSFAETNLLAWYSRAPWRLGIRRTNGAYLSFCFNLGPVVEDKSLHVSSLFLSLLEPLNMVSEESRILLDIPAEEERRADAFLCNCGVLPGDFIIGFNVGAGSPGRIWPKGKFAELAERLIHRYGAKVILFSGPQDGDCSRQIADAIRPAGAVVANQLSLKTLAATISRCKVLVSNDTGPMHLGPAVGVPTLGLFSLGYPENYCPLGGFSRFLERQPIEALGVDEVCSNLTQMIAGDR